jgi:hypothetical protein
MSILESTQPFRNVDFYKDRNDIIIASFSNGVWAIELDKRFGTQNSQPIYKGSGEPRFMKGEGNTLIVSDSGALFIIDI